MSDTTIIRVSRVTRDQLRVLAAKRNETVSETIAHGVRLLQQEAIGRSLNTPEG